MGKSELVQCTFDENREQCEPDRRLKNVLLADKYELRTYLIPNGIPFPWMIVRATDIMFLRDALFPRLGSIVSFTGYLSKIVRNGTTLHLILDALFKIVPSGRNIGRRNGAAEKLNPFRDVTMAMRRTFDEEQNYQPETAQKRLTFYMQ